MVISRAIPINKHRLTELSKVLQQAIAMKTNGVSGPLGRRVLVPSAPYDITTVDGREATIQIRLMSIPTSSPYYVVSGGVGKGGSGATFIVININGTLDAENLYKSASSKDLTIANQIFKVLIHEMTHAADIFTKGIGESLTEEEAQNNPRAYYNHPTEVRAYLQEILEELNLGNYPKFVKLFKGRGRGLEVLLKQSKTWLEMEPYLTESNKRLIIKAVAQQIDQLESEHTKNATIISGVVSRYLGGDQ
jgi:hypothetical protein